MSTVDHRPIVALYYATRDGQARRIADHVSERLLQAGAVAEPRNIAGALPEASELEAAAMVVLVAAVRYGRHLPEADRFLKACRALRAPAPLALGSVNLTARKPGKTTATGNTYLRKLIARHGLAPAIAVAFAGRLEYQRYRWFDRWIIRFIMLLTGGPTESNACVEYTSWSDVDAFADQILDRVLPKPE